MSKKSKNEFQSLCEELSSVETNKIDFVRTQLRTKYKGNLDQLLMVKAEAQEDDYMQYLAIRVSVLAFVASAFGAIGNFVPDTGNLLLDTGKNACYLIIMAYAFARIGIGDKFSSVHKWRKYVLVVIDDLIQESKQIEQDQTKE